MYSPCSSILRPDALLAKVVGTFALVLAATGSIMVNDMSGGVVTHIGVAAAPGLVVAAMIYAVADISAAHFNAAVTIGFRSVGPWQVQVMDDESCRSAPRVLGINGWLSYSSGRSHSTWLHIPAITGIVPRSRTPRLNRVGEDAHGGPGDGHGRQKRRIRRARRHLPRRLLLFR